MPYDPRLADAMRKALRGRPGIEEKKMFGGFCWLLNGNMICSVEAGRFMFRVGKALEAEALSRPGASPMDITRKPMPGFIWVEANAAIESGLAGWIEFASRYVSTLRAK